jgi:hypothetical protein
MKRAIRKIFLVCSFNFVLLSSPAFPETAAPSNVGTALISTIDMMKNSIVRKLSSGDIENSIKQDRNFRIDHYDDGKIGWAVIDSKGREVFRVLLSFIGSKASDGIYLSPLMLLSDANEVYNFHNQIMTGSFKNLGADPNTASLRACYLIYSIR